MPAKRVQVQHYRIDQAHSNSYAAWQALGSPQPVPASQVSTLAQAGQLALLAPPSTVATRQGQATLPITLPRQGVSLLRLTW
ncbi:MAG: hypothetical protein EOO56_19560 [Hymenobacter sp.]|nr:MAG: hypothetical protein EOO56_19560 [Hymenobacter sp.]